jgi:hypothetical protein
MRVEGLEVLGYAHKWHGPSTGWVVFRATTGSPGQPLPVPSSSMESLASAIEIQLNVIRSVGYLTLARQLIPVLHLR